MTYISFDEIRQIERAGDPMAGRPIHRGDTENVVCILSLDLASLRFLAHYLPLDDGFTQDRSRDLDEVLAIIRASRSES